MKNITPFRISLALLASICLVLGLQGCNRDTPEKFIASGKSYLAKRDVPAAIIEFKNALQKAPNSAEARYLLGIAFEELDEPGPAEIELRKALAAGYAPELAYPALIQALLQLGQPEKALAEATHQQENRPRNAQLLALAGDAQFNLGKVQEARAAFSASLTAEPSNQRAMLGTAKVFALERDLPRAHQLVDEVMSADPSSRDALLLKADLLQAERRGKEAAQVYAKAIELRPRSVGVYLALVPLLVREGDLKEARARVEALKKVAPGSPMTRYLDALVSYTQGDRPRAREAVESVLKTVPNYTPGLLLAGNIAYDSANYAQAEDYFLKVIAATPNQAYPRRVLVSTYLRIGQVEEAKDAVNALLRLAPNDTANLSLAGEVALANRDVAKAADYYQKALAIDPNNALSRTRLGQVRLAGGDPERAIQDLEAASAADTSRYQADVSLIVLHLQRKELEKAKAAADGLAKKQPDNPLTYNLQGLVRLAERDDAGGRDSFEHALRLQPTYFPAAHNLAILDLRDAHPEAAKQRYEAVLAKDPKNEQALLALVDLMQSTRAPAPEIEKGIDRAIAANPGAARPRILKINYLLRRGDSKNALSTAQQAQAALPQNLQILEALGSAQLATGENDQAIATFGKLAPSMPKSPGPLLGLAQAYAGVKDWAGARRAIQKAIELQPDSVLAYTGLVRLEMGAGRLKEAQAQARSMQQKWPAQAVGYLAEVDVLVAQADSAEAERVLRRAITKVKGPHLVARLYGLLGAQGRKEQAEAVASDWVAQNPADLVIPTYVAQWSMQQKDYAAAARWYKTVVKAQPNNAIGLNNLAWALGQLQDPGALAYGDKALSLAPNAPAVLDTVGWLYIQQGNFTRGLELLKKAHDLAPGAADIQLNFAKALIKAGQGKEAKQQLEVLAKLPAGTPIRDEAQRLLSSL